MVIDLSNSQTNYFERTDILKRYHDDIRKYVPLTIDEELKLIKIYHTTLSKEEKEKAKNKILCANQRFALGVAKRWATNENIMDLISEANIGMMEALEEYDVSQNVKFITFAVYYIRRAINNYMIKNGNMVRKNNAAKTFHLMSQITNKFIQNEMRQPTSDEIIDILNKEYDIKIKDKNDILNIQVSSIDGDCSSDEDDVNIGTIIEYNEVSASNNECETKSEQEFAQKLVKSAIEKLSSKEQEVIKYAFGIGHIREYELNEIAEKMGFTSERIRQIKNTALEKIKKEYNNLIDKI